MGGFLSERTWRGILKSAHYTDFPQAVVPVLGFG
jgi:hypothetical protein